jgi:hypothetical protein
MAAISVLTSVSIDEVAGSGTAILTVDAGGPSACSVFTGFKPRVVKSTQISGTIGNGAFTQGNPSLAAGYMLQTVANGTTTVVTTNGYTFLDGSEAAPAVKATGSPLAAGPGFTLGTSVNPTASATYSLEWYR